MKRAAHLSLMGEYYQICSILSNQNLLLAVLLDECVRIYLKLEGGPTFWCCR